MTEEEARKKWCVKQKLRMNDGEKVNINCCCIASDCMMWVWDEDKIASVDYKQMFGHCGLSK